MNENELQIYFNHVRSQRMSEVQQSRLRASVMRKAQRQLRVTTWLGRTIGGVITRRNARAARPRPVRLEDCVGLDMP